MSNLSVFSGQNHQPLPTLLSGWDAPLPSAGRKIKTLLVEDDPDLLDVAIDLLELSGCAVTAVSMPEEALALINSEHPPFDLLFTDYRFPSVHTGLTLAEAVQKTTPNIKVILATGFDPSALKTYNGPEYQVVSKPYSLNALEETLTQLFRR